MSTESGIRVLAGTFVLVSLALGAPASPLFVSSAFLWMTAFVGANLLQSAFTGFCPAAMILRRLGTKDAGSAEPSA
jgi:hypothetical protein